MSSLLRFRLKLIDSFETTNLSNFEKLRETGRYLENWTKLLRKFYIKNDSCKNKKQETNSFKFEQGFNLINFLRVICRNFYEIVLRIAQVWRLILSWQWSHIDWHFWNCFYLKDIVKKSNKSLLLHSIVVDVPIDMREFLVQDLISVFKQLFHFDQEFNFEISFAWTRSSDKMEIWHNLLVIEKRYCVRSKVDSQ